MNALHYNDWGSDKTYPHMSVAWTWAFDTPFKWTKQVASHFGGTRQGLAISWPGHIKDPGGIRTQFHHVIDIVPTILEAAGVQAPDVVKGIPQKPIEGVSMLYTFDSANANAPSKRDTQYFEMVGNRAIYHDGWMAATTPPSPPWELGTGTMPPLRPIQVGALQHRGGLFGVQRSRSQQSRQVEGDAGAVPKRKRGSIRSSRLDNTGFVRLLTPKPSATAGVTDFTYTGVNPGIPVGNAPSILNKDYTITAEVTIPSGGAEGVIATLGGRFGGYALMLSPSASWVLSSDLFKKIGWGLLILGLLLLLIGTAGRWRRRFGFACLLVAVVGLVLAFAVDIFHIGRGRPVFVYNLLDLERFRWEGLSSLDEGKHTIVFDFKYDGPGPGKGGTGVLSVDGKEVARKTIEHTIPLLMSIDETFDIGLDTRSPVDFSYEVPFAFTGTIDKLNYKLGTVAVVGRGPEEGGRRHGQSQQLSG